MEKEKVLKMHQVQRNSKIQQTERINLKSTRVSAKTNIINKNIWKSGYKQREEGKVKPTK